MKTIQTMRNGLVRVAVMTAFAASLAVPAFADTQFVCCEAADGSWQCTNVFNCGGTITFGCYCNNWSQDNGYSDCGIAAYCLLIA